MIVKCETCGKEFNKYPKDIKRSSRNFCSKKCYGPKVNELRDKSSYLQPQGSCLDCNDKISIRNKYCKDCREKRRFPIDITLREAAARYSKHHACAAFALVRYRARAVAMSLGWKECAKCGYSKHIEVCHIKPIASYDLDTKINTVNEISNLIALCPNCHWEFDHKKEVGPSGHDPESMS